MQGSQSAGRAIWTVAAREFVSLCLTCAVCCRYVFLYAVHYFFAKTKMSGFFQVCPRSRAALHSTHDNRCHGRTNFTSMLGVFHS